MPLGSDASKNAILDATLGPGQDASVPDPLYLALFNNDPLSGGTELTIGTGNYQRVAVSAATWNDASAGAKGTNGQIAFPTSTAAWSATATHAALMSASTGGIMWDAGALGASITVSASGTDVLFPAGNIVVTQN